METHYTNGFLNYMWSIQQAPPALSNTGGDNELHQKQQEQTPEHTSPAKLKTDPDELRYNPIVQYDDKVSNHHGTKCTPSIRLSSQSGRGKHKKHKRPQIPSQFVPDLPKTYVDGKLATLTEDLGPLDLSDSDSGKYKHYHKGRHHRRCSRRKHGRHGGSGGSGSGSSDAGSSSSSPSSLSDHSWDFNDFFDKDGIWKAPKGHPAGHHIKSYTRKIQTVKHPKRVTLTKWDGNLITFPDKMSEVRTPLTDVGLGYLVAKTFLKYWTTYGNKNLLTQAWIQQWPIMDWSQFTVNLKVFHGMLHQAFGYKTTTKYLFSEDVAKHRVTTYIPLQDLNAISYYDLR
jgi:hypothetical protein